MRVFVLQSCLPTRFASDGAQDKLSPVSSCTTQKTHASPSSRWRSAHPYPTLSRVDKRPCRLFLLAGGGGTTHYIVACIQTEALLASVLVVPEESDVRMTAVRAGSYGRCFGGQRHWTSWAVHKLQREMCDRWKLAWGLGSNVGVVRREHPWPNHDNVHGLMHSGRGVRGGGSTTSRV